MLAIVLIFKSSLLSIWFASKLKILTFLKGLTLTQGIILTIKRWFIDNLLSKWLRKNIFSHLSEGIGELKTYYQAMSFKAKVKNALIFIFPITIATWFMYATEVLTHAALYAELKMLITGFFKGIWILGAKLLTYLSLMIAWLAGSWITPIVEVFALSYHLDLFEKRFGKKNFLSQFFIKTGNFLNTLLTHIGLLNDKHISPLIQKTVVNSSKKLSNKISTFVKNRKISQEFLYFDNLQNIILEGHIDAYHHFKDMHTITDKKELYQRINKETDDNIDIIAYISRNKKGALLDESIPDDYYHDIFLLKGIASHPEHGVKENTYTAIDNNDFWVLNTSKHPVQLKSKNHHYHDRYLEGHSINLIKSTTVNYEDISCEYLGEKVSPTPINQ